MGQHGLYDGETREEFRNRVCPKMAELSDKDLVNLGTESRLLSSDRHLQRIQDRVDDVIRRAENGEHVQWWYYGTGGLIRKSILGKLEVVHYKPTTTEVHCLEMEPLVRVDGVYTIRDFVAGVSTN